MAPVLIVVFAAASLLGYALLRDTAPVESAASLGSWLGKSALGPTEETPIDVDYRLPPFVAKITDSAPIKQPETLPSAEPPTTAVEAPAVLPSAEPPSSIETAPPAPAKAEPASPRKPAARAKKTVRRAATVPAPAAANRAADDRATQQLIERDVERLGTDSVPPATDIGPTYPPGYIEAPIK
jgi:hypothetical protein